MPNNYRRCKTCHKKIQLGTLKTCNACKRFDEIKDAAFREKEEKLRKLGYITPEVKTIRRGQ